MKILAQRFLCCEETCVEIFKGISQRSQGFSTSNESLLEGSLERLGYTLEDVLTCFLILDILVATKSFLM
jgi:hypothetical protein